MTIQEALEGLEYGAELPCGCIVGYFLCPEAEVLWARTQDVYMTRVRSACRNPRSPECRQAQQEYEVAEERYNEHFYRQKMLVQTKTKL